MSRDRWFPAAMIGGAICAVVAGGAAGAALPPDLAEAVHAFDLAQTRSDASALGQLLADDYELLNGDGSVEDRAEFIRDYSEPGFHLDPFKVHQAVIRTWDGGAVLGGVARLTGISGSKRFDRCIRFTDVWSLRGGSWKVAYTHVSPPPPDACRASI